MDSSDIPQKQCSTCPHSYPATPEFFDRDRSKKDGLHTTCKVCGKARCKAYQETHKEQVRENKRLYRDAHKEETAARLRQWQQGERYKVYQKHYQQEHQEEIHRQNHKRYLLRQEVLQERSRQYGKTEQGRLASKVHKHRRKAQKLASQGSHTPRQLQEQLKRQKSHCYYCKAKLSKVWHPDHIVPLSKGGTNDISNIVIACPTCNLRKGAKLPHEWHRGGRLL